MLLPVDCLKSVNAWSGLHFLNKLSNWADVTKWPHEFGRKEFFSLPKLWNSFHQKHLLYIIEYCKSFLTGPNAKISLSVRYWLLYSDFVCFSVTFCGFFAYHTVQGGARHVLGFFGNISFNNTHMHKSNTVIFFEIYPYYVVTYTAHSKKQPIIWFVKLILWGQTLRHLLIPPFEKWVIYVTLCQKVCIVGGGACQ